MSSPRRYWNVEVDAAFEDPSPISEGAALGLLVGVEVLRYHAGDLPAVASNGRAIRRLASERTYRLPDGLIVPPFTIFFELSNDGTTARIVGATEFQPRPENAKLCSSNYVDELTADLLP